jgi:hypothetical protein
VTERFTEPAPEAAEDPAVETGRFEREEDRAVTAS